MKTKFILFSGKGGVGKTSMACTTAIYNADKGLKTLIVTTDPASNLSDVFEQEIGHSIVKIKGIENLHAMEIDPDKSTEEYKNGLLEPMKELFDEEMIKIADEQLSGPCTAEMASFDKFIDFMGEEEYDVIIFDTAPTGHTIRLLELPVNWSKHIEEAAKGSGQTCMGPVSMIEDSKCKFDNAIARLRDNNQTEFIFVMQPEATSLYETLRASEELSQLGISTSKIIVNGFIPKEEAENQFFKSRYEMQQKHLIEAKDAFKGIPMETMELFNTELKGIERFRLIGNCLFNGEELSKVIDENEFKDIKDSVSEKDNVSSLIYPEKNSHKNIFFSGKGGVGKTVMACVTAVRLASKGYKTLLLTTDPAAHIGRVLDKPITDVATKIEGMDNLYAAKIDPKVAFLEYKEQVLKHAKESFNESTVLIMEEELNSPCTEEMAAFQKFIGYAADQEYDAIIFDTAPTGHTLRLLELPMEWSKQIQMKAGINTEISEEDKIQKERFDKVIAMMKDESKTTFAFVMYPEKTPIIEAHRASVELQGAGIQTQMVVANLIIPEAEAKTPFFKNRRNMQEKYMIEIKNTFNKSKIVKVPMYDREIKGLEMLKEISDSIY